MRTIQIRRYRDTVGYIDVENVTIDLGYSKDNCGGGYSISSDGKIGCKVVTMRGVATIKLSDVIDRDEKYTKDLGETANVEVWFTFKAEEYDAACNLGDDYELNTYELNWKDAMAEISVWD